jgi:hypothetical protein
VDGQLSQADLTATDTLGRKRIVDMGNHPDTRRRRRLGLAKASQMDFCVNAS